MGVTLNARNTECGTAWDCYLKADATNSYLSLTCVSKTLLSLIPN